MRVDCHGEAIEVGRIDGDAATRSGGETDGRCAESASRSGLRNDQVVEDHHTTHSVSGQGSKDATDPIHRQRDGVGSCGIQGSAIVLHFDRDIPHHGARSGDGRLNGDNEPRRAWAGSPAAPATTRTARGYDCDHC